MALTFRTTGTWGQGKGSNLTEAELDTNFYTLNNSVLNIENNPLAPKSIQSITTTNNNLTFTLEDNSTFGPYKFPFNNFVNVGEWEPNTTYFYNNIVSVPVIYSTANSPSGLYFVNNRHSSYIPFDAGRLENKILAYQKLFSPLYFKNLVTPVFPASIPAYTLIRNNEDVYLTLESISPANQTAFNNLVTNNKVINITNVSRIEFKYLKDVTEYTNSDANKFYKVNLNGTSLDPSTISVSDISNITALTNNANKILAVDSSTTAITAKDFSFLELGDIGTTLWSYSAYPNKYLKVSANETYIDVDTSGFVNSFLNYTDTPSSFTGYGGRYVSVNSSESSLEYTLIYTPRFTELTDAPQNYTNAANKFVSVNANGNGVEFLDGVSGNPKSTLTYLATQTPSGVTNIEFLNIPNTAKRIFIMFSGLKASSNADFIIQFGNSSGYITTGYTSFYSYLRTGLNGSSGLLTTGLLIQSGSSTNISYGFAKLELLDSASRIWAYNYTDALIQNNNTYFTSQCAGSKTLGANVDLTKIKIVSSNGTDTFGSGSTLSLAYE